MENSLITWCHHTFNPWIGCTKVSEGCRCCYAEELMDKRYHKVPWGLGLARHHTSKAYWRNPIKWNRKALAAGRRDRVFCASLADVFDSEASVEPAWRVELFELIRATPQLDWLVLTKRPQNIAEMLPRNWGAGYPNVWLGVSTENQATADERLPILTRLPARIRFASAEPLLGPISFTQHLFGLHWIIVGGESGRVARPMEAAWASSIIEECPETAIFVKQLGNVLGRQLGLRSKVTQLADFPEALRVQAFPV